MGKLQNPRLQFKPIYFTLLLLSAVVHVNTFSLNSDGYYQIVIAVDEKTAQNSNDKYIENLKVSVQDLSDAIYESTDCSFSISDVDIVLPNHWITEADGFATTQNYKNADIRISHEFLVPQTINPTFCGYPGKYIELPYSIFDEKDSGIYGPTGKALLTLWARYRWGIYEEHGYPGDPQFPYYWKEWSPWEMPEEGEDIVEPKPEEWKVTSCSDEEIKGHFETLRGEQCGPDHVPDPEDGTTTGSPDDTTPIISRPGRRPFAEDDEPDYPPPSECRFFPEVANQSASTSLMSFPFIKSLLHFCDDTNHNKRAPNRQNLFCQFKSTWEVIIESKDWKQLAEHTGCNSVGGPSHARRPINYRVLKKTDKPLLYILSEGVNKPPEEVISAMVSNLDYIFNKSENWNVLASLGVFPSMDVRDSYDTIYNWNTPWQKREDFISTFQESFDGSRNSTMFRNFGAAIQDIGNLIKQKDHSAGAVIVVIKYGSETDENLKLQFQTYESEVTATIIQQNIRLFALEGADDQADSDPSYPFRLKNLAEMSGGQFFQIGTGDPVQDIAHVNNVMSEVDNILMSGHVPASRYRLAFKDARLSSPSGEYTLPILVNYQNVKSLTFYLDPITKASDLFDLEMSRAPDGITAPIFNRADQWGKTEFDYATYIAKWTATPGQSLTGPSSWDYSFYSMTTDCNTLMVVIAELEEDAEAEDDVITVSISTSGDWDNNMVDLSVESAVSLKATAFSIYAQLEKNGHPISGPDVEVTAHILHFREGKDVYDSLGTANPIGLTVIPLIDAGQSRPTVDLTANDGIFSGNFIPSGDNWGGANGDRGIFQIFVTARLLPKTNPRSEPEETLELVQKCGGGYQGCWTETVTQPFFKMAELTRRIKFKGAEQYYMNDLAAVTRVLDLRASQEAPGRYKIEWTTPALEIETGPVSGYLFEMHYANDFDQLLLELFKDKIPDIDMPDPVGPGSLKSVVVDDLEEGENRWYVLNTIAKADIKDAIKPVWSNVVFIHGSSSFFMTTTTTTTTTTPAPPISTTRISTLEPTPSTKPTPAPTTLSTTSTRRTSTTPRTTTTVTTTTPRTTFRFETTTEEIKRWYKTPEAVATFSVFSVGMLGIIGGLLAYLYMTNKDE